MPSAPTFASGPALREGDGSRVRRDFPGRWLTVNLMRALHLVALAGFAAATAVLLVTVLVGAPVTAPGPGEAGFRAPPVREK